MDSRTEAETWQTRVVDDKTELDAKIKRLDLFLKSDANITDEYKGLLESQYTAMVAYSDILQQRLNLFD